MQTEIILSPEINDQLLNFETIHQQVLIEAPVSTRGGGDCPRSVCKKVENPVSKW